MFEAFFQDTRLGLRLIAKYPLYSVVAVLTLSLGIGANTAIFSLVNGVLLRPLPYPNSERLLHLSGGAIRGTKDQNGISVPDFQEYRKEARGFEHMALFSFFPASMVLIGAGEPEQITVIRVSASFLETMGIKPQYGRGFLSGEETPGHDTVVLLSHLLWRRRFGSDPSVVGKTVTLDSSICTVVGIMPAGFEFPRNAEAWVPLGRGLSSRLLGMWEAKMFLAVGRLRAGARLETARAQLATIGDRLEQESPKFNRGYRLRAVPLLEQTLGDIRPTLWMLAAVVGLVLLIACANVANLMLARAAARKREIAVRTALGAGRGRLLRQLLTESVLLALLGGLLGVLLAWWALDILRILNPQGIPRLNEVRVDLTVMLFTLSASLLTGILFGLAPALHASGGNLNEYLKEGSRGSSGGVTASRLRGALVVLEVSLAMVLLAGAGLLLESLRRLVSVDAGFRPDDVVTMQISLPPGKYRSSPVKIRFMEQLLERVRTIPGVQSAGATWILPMGGIYSFLEFFIEGEPPPVTKPLVGYTGVTPGYLETLRVPLVRGRFFESRDRSGVPNAIVISQPMALRFFPGQDPIGRKLTLHFGFLWTGEIIGVSGGIRHGGLAEEPRQELYVCNAQLPHTTHHLVVRTGLDPVALAAAVREHLRRMDPDLALFKVRTMEQVIAESIAQPRFRGFLVALFAASALVLASVGIYGVIAFSVSRRRQEIGIRMALGASPSDVLVLILRQSLMLVVAGILIGLAAALVLGRAISSLLYGIGASDPVILTTVSLLLLGVALAAALIPARRATKIDPLEALRYE